MANYFAWIAHVEDYEIGNQQLHIEEIIRMQ